MKRFLFLTMMCVIGLFTDLKAQCDAPQNVRARAELNVPDYDKKYKITITWDAVEGAESYEIHVASQYISSPISWGTATTNKYILGFDADAELYFYVKTVCDQSAGTKSELSEKATVILSENIQEEHDIIVTVNPANAGTVTGEGYYNENEIVTLTASPNAGYKFVSWTENGNIVSTESQYLFTFSSKRQLVANFELISGGDDTQEPEFASKLQQNRNVLIEELTGINCQYCPAGHAVANNIVNNNLGRVWAVNVHSGIYAPTSYPNFNTTASAAICNAFTNGSFPSGIVNRSTSTAESRSYWSNTTSYRLSETAECNIGGQVIINHKTRIATIEVEAYYTGSSTSSNNYLTVMMLQDSILGPQSGGSTHNPSQMIGDQYVHMHILRDIITPTWGESISPTTAGTLIKRTYTYEIPESIGTTNGVTVDLNNIHFLAFVTEKQDGTATRPILNVNQIPIVTGNEVNITATANPFDGGTVTGAGTYSENDVVTLTATANTGYKFVNWTEDGSVMSTEAKYLFIASKNRTLVANFEEITPTKYNVTATVNPVNAGSVSGTGTYNKHTNVTLTATPNQGYSFVNWTESGNVVSTNAQYSFTITSNRNLVANFEEIYVEPDIALTFKYEGNAIEPGTINIVSDLNADNEIVCDLNVVNITSKDLNVVLEVTDNSNGIGSNYFCWGECYSPGTLKATYPVNTGNEGIFTGHSKFVDGNGNVLDNNTEIHLVYTFYTETRPENKYTFNVNFKYKEVEHTVTATATPENAGTISGTGSYVENTIATLTATPNVGYKFAKWTENGNTVSTEAQYSFTITSDRTLVANFELLDYDVTATASPQNAGAITGAGNYKHGDNVTLTATPNVGYKFVNWKENGNVVSTNSQYSFTITNDRNFVANFELLDYDLNVTVNPVNSGVVSGDGNYYHGETVTLTAMPNVGYRFLNWTENGIVVAEETTYTFVITPDRNLVANFELLDYDVTATASPQNAGAITGAGNYKHGDNVTLTATPNEGYKFVNWTENGNVVSTNSQYSFTITNDRNFVANFELLEYEVTANASPENAGTITGAGNYKHGDNVTLTATPNEGYKFVNWTENENVVSTNSQYSFTITNDRNLVANFEEIYVEPDIALTFKYEGNAIEPGTINIVSDLNAEKEIVCDLNVINITSKDLNIVLEITDDPNGIGSNYFCWGDCYLPGTLKATHPVSTGNEGIFTGHCKFVDNEGDVLDKGTEIHMVYTFYTESRPENKYTFNVNFKYKDDEPQPLPTYTVTAVANPENAGTISGAGSYDENTTVTLTATPNEGYNFLNWTENGEVVSTETQYSFTISSDRNFVANFEEIKQPEDGDDEDDNEDIEELTASLLLYPNPIYDKLIIESEVEIEKVIIFDIYGRSQQSIVNNQQSLTIDISDLNSGVYFVKIITNKYEVTKRIIKK